VVRSVIMAGSYRFVMRTPRIRNSAAASKSRSERCVTFGSNLAIVGRTCVESVCKPPEQRGFAVLALAMGGQAENRSTTCSRGLVVLKNLSLMLMGQNGDRGLPGGKPTWGPVGRAALDRVLSHGQPDEYRRSRISTHTSQVLERHGWRTS